MMVMMMMMMMMVMMMPNLNTESDSSRCSKHNVHQTTANAQLMFLHKNSRVDLFLTCAALCGDRLILVALVVSAANMSCKYLTFSLAVLGCFCMVRLNDFLFGFGLGL